MLDAQGNIVAVGQGGYVAPAVQQQWDVDSARNPPGVLGFDLVSLGLPTVGLGSGHAGPVFKVGTLDL
jgi:hypothetical protein